MTTPKPVALPELPLKKFCVDGEAWAYTGKQMHAYALSAIAMHRAEVERLREALRELVEASTAKFPPATEGVHAQNAWSGRIDAAFDAARAALSSNWRNQGPSVIAALYVETDGAYFGLPGVDPWDEARDARKYAGPHPVVAHPPCQRWGRFWHGSTRKPHQFKLGDDGGCFEAAIKALRRFGGVLEHPADSHAWAAFGLNKPPRSGGWVYAGHGFWTCCVYQGQYGHLAGKPTWLLACGMQRDELPELRWGKTEQRLHPTALAKHGYEKARRIGMMAMVGGKDKTRIRNATPPEFRDVLLSLARATNKD